MDELEISYLQNVYKQTKDTRQYLQKWNAMNDAEKKTSIKENQALWDDIYDETALDEDKVEPKKVNLEGCIEEDKLPVLIDKRD